MAFEVGGGATVQKFGFSASRSYRNMQSKMTNSSKYISDLSYYQSSSQMKLKPIAFADLDDFARTSINMSLIGSYESNPKAYDLLLDSLGTHYIQTANLGGLVRVILETKREYFITATEEQAKTNAGATFLNFLSVKGMVSKETRNVESAYTSSTTRTVKYYGGDINLMEGSSYERWQPTVEQNPWMFSCEVQPISKLIQDEAKRASLDQAITRRVYLSYLDEMDKLIKSFSISDPVLSNLTNWIASIKNKTVMDESEVEAVGKAVEFHASVPVSFLKNTRLCFQWEKTWDGRQCGGNVNKYLCAGVNAMTQPYKDDTDYKLGGCRLQWGLQSSQEQPWLSGVNICFAWSSDGGKAKCAGQSTSSGSYCAGVNSLTTKYMDDTGPRDGGCGMRWMLNVSSTAPLWLKTVKVCFSWTAEKDAGQCGPNVREGNFCALANQWTQMYYDFSDNRKGGCLLQWGLKI